MADGKFLTMINHGVVYQPTEAAVERAVEAGVPPLAIAEELAFVLAMLLVQEDVREKTVITMLRRVAKVRTSCDFYSREARGDA